MAENQTEKLITLDDVESDMKGKSEADWRATLESWYLQQKTKIDSGPYDDAQKTSLKAKLDDVRRNYYEAVEEIKKGTSVKQKQVSDTARQFMEHTRIEAEKATDPRHQKFEMTRTWTLGMTDPNKDGAQIDDYPGTGEANTLSPTRMKLTGYLTALKLYDDANLKKNTDVAFNIAVQAYSEHTMDKALDEDDLLDKVGLRKYADMLSENGIDLNKMSAEGAGYLAGLLKVAEIAEADEPAKQAYRNYLFAEVKKLIDGGKFDYNPLVDPNAPVTVEGNNIFYIKDGAKRMVGMADSPNAKEQLQFLTTIERGRYEMIQLEGIKNPDEWMKEFSESKKKLDEVLAEYDKVKGAALKISGAWKFSYADVRVRGLLAKEHDAVKPEDREEIDYARGQVQVEALAKLRETYTAVGADGDKYESILGQAEELNKTSKKFPDAEMTEMRTGVNSLIEKYKGLAFEDADTLDTLATKHDTLFAVYTDLESRKPKIDKIFASLKPAEAAGAVAAAGAETPLDAGEAVSSDSDSYAEQWSQGKEVDGRFKVSKLRVAPSVADTPYRDDNGKIQGKIPGGADVKRVDAKGKQVGEVVFVRVTYTDKNVWVDEGQLESNEPVTGGAGESADKPKEAVDPDVEKFLSAKNLKVTVDAATGKRTYTLGDSTDNPLAPGSQVNSSGNYEVDSKFWAQYVNKKLTVDEMKALEQLFFDAGAASALEFDHQPTAKELQDAYDKKFTPVWEYVGKFGKVPPKEGVAGATPEVGPMNMKNLKTYPELQFLGPVYIEYSDALSKLVKNGANPDGTTFKLNFDNGPVEFRFIFDPSIGKYKLNWPKGAVTYGSIEEAAKSINSGAFHKQLTEFTLLDKTSFEPYKKTMGQVDESKYVDGTHDIAMELDWTNPDAQVTVRALPHGLISYTLVRKNAGIYGEEMRSGYAHNVKDFISQMGHIRSWAEGPQHTNTETAETKKEILYNTITNSSNFRNIQAEAQIGRTISFEIQPNELVQLYLDWNGTNTMVNTWVEANGDLLLTVNDGKSIKAGPEKVADFAALMARVSALRAEAFSQPA